MYSAVMDLASHVATDLGDAGTGLTADELKKQIQARKCAVQIDVNDLLESRKDGYATVRQDAKLHSRNRGMIGYFFTKQDMDKVKAVLPKWRAGSWRDRIPVAETKLATLRGQKYARLSETFESRLEGRETSATTERKAGVDSTLTSSLRGSDDSPRASMTDSGVSETPTRTILSEDLFRAIGHLVPEDIARDDASIISALTQHSWPPSPT
ncbi:hypothetical protein LTR85_001841 [Meristemomyces frigidus]|nr:hypothetical protein LTR85_001841 [Meristemomyces frigidus]